MTEDKRLMIVEPQAYECERHGTIYSTVSFFGRGGLREGDYCMECYKDLIRAHCCPATTAGEAK